MSRFVTFLLLPLLLGCSPAGDVRSEPTVRILTLGDSNTDALFTTMYGQGRPWPATLQTLLSAADPSTTYELINDGSAGSYSSDVADSIRESLASTKPDVVFCMIGTNDVCGDHAPDTPPLTLAQTEANVRTVIEAVQNSGATMVLMQAPPATSRTMHDSGQTAFPFWRSRTIAEGASNLHQLKELYAALASEYDIPLVATWDNTAALGFDGSQPQAVVHERFVYDGVHITRALHDSIAAWAVEALPAPTPTD